MLTKKQKQLLDELRIELEGETLPVCVEFAKSEHRTCLALQAQGYLSGVPESVSKPTCVANSAFDAVVVKL